MARKLRMFQITKKYTFKPANKGPCCWKSFPLATPNSNDKEQPDHVLETSEGLFGQSSSFRRYRKQTLNDFQQQENELIADLHTRLTVLLEKCNYNQCYMNTHYIGLFIHAVEYFCCLFMGKGRASRFSTGQILDKAKLPETTVAQYHYNKWNG